MHQSLSRVLNFELIIYHLQGVLDSLANRAIAQGTNAWTDLDHTCYSMDYISPCNDRAVLMCPFLAINTAGSDGFLRLLPIYVDHILYPTLTESGYHTEVHHINGKGEDAGKCGLFASYEKLLIRLPSLGVSALITVILRSLLKDISE